MSNACMACARAKRSCGKQLPRCLRCRKRDMVCSYPAPKPSSFVLYTGPSPTVIKEDTAPRVDSTPRFPDHSRMWFLSPDTWEISRFVPTDRKPPGAAELKPLVARIHHWLGEWAKKGHTQFVHPRLYRHRLPSCIQDAYTTLIAYTHRTNANEAMIFPIVRDKATALVREHRLASGDAKPGSPDPFERLAQVQALLIYQGIGLYNGDIGLRHLAESHLPVLYEWMISMVKCASQATCLGRYMLTESAQQEAPSATAPDYDRWEHADNLLWYSWILAESIRRTWGAGAGLQGTYSILQKGDSSSCQGGMNFTARQGVWEADSAVEWEMQCCTVDVGFVPVKEAEALISKIPLHDINEFALMSIHATWGPEKMTRWGLPVLAHIP